MSKQTRQRNFISALLQKREISLLKKNVPEPKNTDLAKQFGISPGQVADINYLQQGDIEITTMKEKGGIA